VDAVERLIHEFEKMPSIGRKSAQRLAFYVLQLPPEEAHALSQAITDVKEKIRRCTVCGNATEAERCSICTDARRDAGIMAIVEQPADIMAFERTGGFRGVYHVLHGALSPLEGVGPDQIPSQAIVDRIRNTGIREVILATNPTVEGEATAVFLTRLIQPLGVRVTRLARGIPVGTDLEFVDQATLTRALEGRTEVAG
jgi:recombination protein RecR